MANALLCATFWLATCCASLAQEQPKVQSKPASTNAPDLSMILETVKNVFGRFHLAPILVPEGERVGDILDVDNGTLIAGPDDCFPGLKPRQTEGQLPAITILSEKGLAAALGVGEIAQAEGENQARESFVLDFMDVRVERVSQYQLRNSLRKNVQECDTVRAFLDASAAGPQAKLDQRRKVRVAGADHAATGALPAVVSEKPPPLLVGMVFYARRVIHVATAESLSGDAKLSFGEQLLNRLGLGSTFKIAGSGSNSSSGTVDLIGQKSVPVALGPAFVITTSRQLAGGRTSYEVASVNPEFVQEQIQVANRDRLRPGTELAAVNRLFRQYPSVAGFVASRAVVEVARIGALKEVLGRGS